MRPSDGPPAFHRHSRKGNRYGGTPTTDRRTQTTAAGTNRRSGSRAAVRPWWKQDCSGIGDKFNGSSIADLPRVPISTRMRSEYSDALKRASLERQLNKVEPNSVQDILRRHSSRG